jgi:hypothetical protein
MNTNTLKELQLFLEAFPAMYAPEHCSEEDCDKAFQIASEHGGMLYWAGRLKEAVNGIHDYDDCGDITQTIQRAIMILKED